MRLHEQLGGPEPDEEVEALLIEWRRLETEGADTPLRCPTCLVTTNDGELCGECLSERAEYYHPDQGGEG